VLAIGGDAAVSGFSMAAVKRTARHYSAAANLPVSLLHTSQPGRRFWSTQILGFVIVAIR
jgi:hypothetical protein